MLRKMHKSQQIRIWQSSINYKNKWNFSSICFFIYYYNDFHQFHFRSCFSKCSQWTDQHCHLLSCLWTVKKEFLRHNVFTVKKNILTWELGPQTCWQHQAGFNPKAMTLREGSKKKYKSVVFDHTGGGSPETTPLL